MQSTDKKRIDVARALRDLADRAAPRMPDLSGAYGRAPALHARRSFVARVALPLAAAACLCALVAALAPSLAPRSASGGTALARELGLEAGYRERTAGASAALALGMDAWRLADEGDYVTAEPRGVEASLLGYIESLWAGEADI